MSNFCCTFAAILAYRFDLVMSKASSVEITGAFFLLLFAVFVFKNDKKCKKMQKNEKKSQKNLHISKKSCIFAPNLKNNPISNPKIYQIMTTKVNKQKVIARIIKGGFNPKYAEKMTTKFWDLAERRGCQTIRDYYEAITWFWAV